MTATDSSIRAVGCSIGRELSVWLAGWLGCFASKPQHDGVVFFVNSLTFIMRVFSQTTTTHGLVGCAVQYCSPYLVELWRDVRLNTRVMAFYAFILCLYLPACACGALGSVLGMCEGLCTCSCSFRLLVFCILYSTVCCTGAYDSWDTSTCGRTRAKGTLTRHVYSTVRSTT